MQNPDIGVEHNISQCRSEQRESRPSQWEQLLKNFAQTHEEKCETEFIEMPKVSRSQKVFPTGSQYLGTWDLLGMGGEGTYTFPNGVEYKGQFKDGMFHGHGELRYPGGIVIKGKWQDGVMFERTLVFPDSVHYNENNWRYCTKHDRRFAIEYKKGLKPAGESYKTADQPTRAIPSGYFDTGDGFYDPKTRAIYDPSDLTSIIRSPNVREQQWIVENCRTSSDENIGPRQKLYSEWPQANIMPREIPVPAAFCETASLDTIYSDRIPSELQVYNFPNLDESLIGSISNSSDSDI